MPYSIPMPEERAARAFGRNLRVSWKSSINIARAIQGMKVQQAEKWLEDVVELRRPVPMLTHKGKIPHRRGAGFGPGRFPKKAADAVLGVLRNAMNNAEYNNLDPDEMVIQHAQAYKGLVIKRFQPRARGSSGEKFEQTTNFEMIIEEVDEDEEDS